MYRELRACVGVHLTKCSHVRRPCRIMEHVRVGGWGMLRANGEVNETPASNNSASVNHTRSKVSSQLTCLPILCS